MKVKAFSHEEEHWVTWLEIKSHGKLAEILTPARAEQIALGMWKRYEDNNKKIWLYYSKLLFAILGPMERRDEFSSLTKRK